MNTEIILPSPAWNSEITRVILDLEKLRQQLYSEVPPYIFYQLKTIFQILETLGSARIEGNNTTLAEYVEKIIDKSAVRDEKRQELENIDAAILFIEEQAQHHTRIDRAYLSEIHKIVTRDLTPPPLGEGSNYPGELRPHNVEIQKSHHTPPSVEKLAEAFENFIAFINSDLQEQNQLLMVAIAHHRFMHIHPFDNGNGRMGRLLNYALLLKLGFNVDAGGRILNPSSVFYTDRDKYYEMLAHADSLQRDDLLAWAEYFLSGLRNQ
ncbi:MAG: Fic family protein, partial [Rickettsiales bacterium]